MVTVVVAWAPPGPVAVTVYCAAGVATDATPVITPLFALRVSPAGSDGLTDHAVRVPPDTTG
jgi:hypothetical protein